MNQVAAGKAQQGYMNYIAESKYQQGQAAIAQAQAQSTAFQDTAKIEGKQLKTSQAEFNSSQRAAMAAAGVQGGTAEDIIGNTLTKQQMDEAIIRYNADIRSWEANTQAQYDNYALQTEAESYRIAGRNARTAGKRQAFATLLGTAAMVAPSVIGAFKPAPISKFAGTGSFSKVPYR